MVTGLGVSGDGEERRGEHGQGGEGLDVVVEISVGRKVLVVWTSGTASVRFRPPTVMRLTILLGDDGDCRA